MSESTDLSFATDKELMQELASRSSNLFLVREPLNDPHSMVEYVGGSYVWVLGALTSHIHIITKMLITAHDHTPEREDEIE